MSAPEKIWRPVGHMFGSIEMVRLQFRAEHPEAHGELRVHGEPGLGVMRRVEFWSLMGPGDMRPLYRDPDRE